MFLLTAASSTTTTATGSPITATEAFTTMHLILIGVLIVLVIAAILWGARQKSNRAAGERDEVERNEALLAHPQTETAVSPAPPPLGDSGMTAGAALQPEVTPPATPAPKPKAAVNSTAPVAKPKTAAKPAAAKGPAAKAPAPTPATPKATTPKSAAKPEAAPTPAPAASNYALIDVKGLGPKAVPLLEAQGVRDLATLAALSPARAAEIDAGLGALSGRMARDKWIEQAKLLAAGNVAEFEATYGKL